MINFIKLRRPFRKYNTNRVNIMLTLRCNLHCKYCSLLFHSWRWPKSPEIDYTEWLTIFNRLETVSEIVLTGGEPLLYPDIVRVINYLASLGHIVYVYTNLVPKIDFAGILKSRNVVFWITEHQIMNEEQKKQFAENLKEIRKRFAYEVSIIGKTKKLQTAWDDYYEPFLSSKVYYMPDGSLHMTLQEAFDYLRRIE